MTIMTGNGAVCGRIMHDGTDRSRLIYLLALHCVERVGDGQEWDECAWERSLEHDLDGSRKMHRSDNAELFLGCGHGAVLLSSCDRREPSDGRTGQARPFISVRSGL